MASAQPNDDSEDQKYQRNDDRENGADEQNLEIGQRQCGIIQRFRSDGESGFAAHQAVEQRDIVFPVNESAAA